MRFVRRRELLEMLPMHLPVAKIFLATAHFVVVDFLLLKNGYFPFDSCGRIQ